MTLVSGMQALLTLGELNKIFFLFTSFVNLVTIAVFLLDCLSNWMKCLKAHGSRVISIKITRRN